MSIIVGISVLLLYVQEGPILSSVIFFALRFSRNTCFPISEQSMFKNEDRYDADDEAVAE